MAIPVLLADSQGLGALGISMPALIFELINFGILYWVLKRYAYRPIVDMLEQRRQHIETSLKKAEEAAAAGRAVEAERHEILEQAKLRAAEIKSEAVSEAETRKAEIIAEAEGTAAHIISQAKRETERQVAAAQTELETQAKELVVGATEAIIGERLDEKRDVELINRALQATKSGGRRG